MPAHPHAIIAMRVHRYYSKAAVAKENSQTFPGNERSFFEGLIYYLLRIPGSGHKRVRNTSLTVLRSARCSIASFGGLPPPFICDLHCPELSTGPWGAAEKAASNSSCSPSHPLLHNHSQPRPHGLEQRDSALRRSAVRGDA